MGINHSKHKKTLKEEAAEAINKTTALIESMNKQLKEAREINQQLKQSNDESIAKSTQFQNDLEALKTKVNEDNQKFVNEITALRADNKELTETNSIQLQEIKNHQNFVSLNKEAVALKESIEEKTKSLEEQQDQLKQMATLAEARVAEYENLQQIVNGQKAELTIKEEELKDRAFEVEKAQLQIQNQQAELAAKEKALEEKIKQFESSCAEKNKFYADKEAAFYNVSKQLKAVGLFNQSPQQAAPQEVVNNNPVVENASELAANTSPRIS